jgi:hypothetical protein
MQILKYYNISILILFIIACAAEKNLNQDTNLDKIFGERTQVDGPFTIEQIETDNMITIEKNGKSVTLPFGYINDDWETLKVQYQEGDGIYKFSSDQESWDRLAGRAGYALIRDNQIIAEIITLMN